MIHAQAKPKTIRLKKNRKLGDVIGGRRKPRLKNGIFSRRHSLLAPGPGENLPLFMQDNPSGRFYFPVNEADVKEFLISLPEEHTQKITHIWFRKVRQTDYMSGGHPQAQFTCNTCYRMKQGMPLTAFIKGSTVRLPTQKRNCFPKILP